FALVADILVGNYLRKHMVVDGWSPAGGLRTICSANETYRSNFGNGYATRLDQLAGPSGGVENCQHALLIDSETASGRKGGYIFRYDAKASSDPPAKGCQEPGALAYAVTADPIEPAPEKRHFFIDETGVLRVEKDKPATAKSPPIE